MTRTPINMGKMTPLKTRFQRLDVNMVPYSFNTPNKRSSALREMEKKG